MHNKLYSARRGWVQAKPRGQDVNSREGMKQKREIGVCVCVCVCVCEFGVGLVWYGFDLV